MRRFLPFGRCLLGCAALALLVACADESTTEPRERPDEPALAMAPLQDGSINPNDTYYAADVSTEAQTVVEMSTPVMDPATGQYTQTIVDDRPRETAHFEVGYDYSDQLVSVVHGSPGTVRSTGDRVVVTDAAGRVLSSMSSFHAFNMLGILPVSFPSLNDANVLGGALLDPDAAPDCGTPETCDGGGFPPTESLIPADGAKFTVAQASTSGRDSKGGPKIEHLSDGRMRLSARVGPEGGESTVTRTYSKQAKKDETGKPTEFWVLDEMEFTHETRPPNGGGVRIHSVERFKHVRWNVNVGAEQRRWKKTKERKEKKNAGKEKAGVGVRSGPAAVPMVLPEHRAIPARQFLVGPRPHSPLRPHAASTFSPLSASPTLAGAAGPILVFQHGLHAAAPPDVWVGMKREILTRFAPAATITSNVLDTEQPVPAQALELKRHLDEQGANDNVLIGHSQGGLMARRVGQMIPERTRGVITIGTPNTGAIIALRPPQESLDILTNSLVYAVGGSTCSSSVFDFFVCVFADEATQTATRVLLPDELTSDYPARRDDAPHSPFLDSLNTRFESFRRAGIESDPGPVWALARMGGDADTPYDVMDPHGQTTVDQAQTTYEIAWWAEILGQALMYYSDYYYGCSFYDQVAGYCDPFAGYGYGGYYYSSRNYWWRFGFWLFQLGSITRRGMDAIDFTWDWLTTAQRAYKGTDGTDGFIQQSGQRYPDSPGMYPPVRYIINENADSHLGETHSPEVLSKLVQELSRLNVPQRVN